MKLKFFIFAFHVGAGQGHRFVIESTDMSSVGWVMCEEREIDFEPPPETVLVAGTIAGYRAEQAKIRADATVKVNAIEETIQSLLSIEHKPDADAEAAQVEL